MSASANLKGRFYLALEPTAWGKSGLSPANQAIVLLIILASAFAILDTEETISSGNEALFHTASLFFTAVFLIEYLLRVWIAPLNPQFACKRYPRLSYIFSPLAIVDLVAIAPYLLSAAGGWFVVLRFARLLRLLRLASLGRFSAAWGLVSSAINERRMELLMSLGVGVLALLVSSTLLYWIEGSEQPEDFGSIPRAMWWAVATLTTVGYGDAMPITAAGKVVAGFVAVIGIGLIAMPTGILAAAFSDAMQRHKQQSRSDDR